MKTGILTIFAISVLLIFAAGDVFAACVVQGGDYAARTTNSAPQTLTIGSAGNQMTVNMGKGVVLQYCGSQVDNFYNIGSSHLSGNRQFGTGSGVTGIWWAACSDDSCSNDALSSPTKTASAWATSDAGSWSAL